MTANQRSLLALLPGLVGVMLLFFTRWYLAGIILVFVSVPLMFLLLRCPHCGRYLGRNYNTGASCPHCGKKIQ